jgi:hypothetical protein
MSKINFQTLPDTPPIVIGGTGGSGTRVVAKILSRCGVYIGKDLNSQLDNLLFTLLFKRPIFFTRKSLTKLPNSRTLLTLHHKLYWTIPPKKYQELFSLLKAFSDQLRWRWYGVRWLLKRFINFFERPKIYHNLRWGWKEPLSMFYIPSLLEFYPDLKFILVIRNGLDMVYSKNQQHIDHWGPVFSIDNTNKSQADVFNFWFRVNKHAQETASAILGKNFLTVKFEDLCLNTSREVRRLVNYAGINPNGIPSDVISLPTLPQSHLRFLTHDDSWINQIIKYQLNELGYNYDDLVKRS